MYKVLKQFSALNLVTHEIETLSVYQEDVGSNGGFCDGFSEYKIEPFSFSINTLIEPVATLVLWETQELGLNPDECLDTPAFLISNVLIGKNIQSAIDDCNPGSYEILVEIPLVVNIK
jgi:hypothetical protein